MSDEPDRAPAATWSDTPWRTSDSVLLTGASGFLGGILLNALRETRAVATLGRRPVEGGALHVAHDLGAEEVPSLPDCSLVVHAAGVAHRTGKAAVPEAVYTAVHVEGTRRLLAALDRDCSAPPRFVLISTVAVYGREAGEDLTEDEPARATDPYGATKWEAERLVLAWGESRGIRPAILRLPLVAGPAPPGNLGAMIRAIRGGWFFTVGDGSARRSWVWAEDVAGILERAAEVGGTFHLTDGTDPTIAEMAAGLARCAGRGRVWRLPVTVARMAALAGDTAARAGFRGAPLDGPRLNKMLQTLTFSCHKAASELGWKPRAILDHPSQVFGDLA